MRETNILDLLEELRNRIDRLEIENKEKDVEIRKLKEKVEKSRENENKLAIKFLDFAEEMRQKLELVNSVVLDQEEDLKLVRGEEIDLDRKIKGIGRTFLKEEEQRDELVYKQNEKIQKLEEDMEEKTILFKFTQKDVMVVINRINEVQKVVADHITNCDC